MICYKESCIEGRLCSCLEGIVVRFDIKNDISCIIVVYMHIWLSQSEIGYDSEVPGWDGKILVMFLSS